MWWGYLYAVGEWDRLRLHEVSQQEHLALVNVSVSENATVGCNISVHLVLLYCFDMRDKTAKSSRRFDAFDQWCLRRVLWMSFAAYVTIQEVRRKTAQPPDAQTIRAKRLRMFEGPRTCPRCQYQRSSERSKSASWWSSPNLATNNTVGNCTAH